MSSTILVPLSSVDQAGTETSLSVFGYVLDGQVDADALRAAALRLRAMPPHALDATLRDIEARLAAEDVPTRVYEDLLELHRCVAGRCCGADE